MTNKQLAKKCTLSVLKDGMEKLGLDPDEADTKLEAIESIQEKFATDAAIMEYECPNCGADMPDLEFCPFCGADLRDVEDDDDEDDEDDGDDVEEEGGDGVEDDGDEEDDDEGEEGEEEKPKKAAKGAKRGRSKSDGDDSKGDDLLKMLIQTLGMPQEFVHWRKSRTSLWCEHGLIGKCFPGKRSLRVHVPYPADQYTGEEAEAVIDFEKSIKNMPARISLEHEDDVGVAADIMAQTVLMKKKEKENKKPRSMGRAAKEVKKETKEAAPKKAAKAPSRPSKPKPAAKKATAKKPAAKKATAKKGSKAKGKGKGKKK